MSRGTNTSQSTWLWGALDIATKPRYNLENEFNNKAT